MLLAFILVTVVTVLLVWLLFSLASLALPLLVGTIAGQAAHHAGVTLIGACLTGLAAGAGTLFLGQLLLATLRNSVSRTGVVVLFAAPAAVAGYNAGRGVAAIGTTSPLVQLLFGIGVAIIVTGAAIARLRAGVPVAATLSDGASGPADRSFHRLFADRSTTST